MSINVGDIISLTKFAEVKSLINGVALKAVDLHDNKMFEIHGKDLQDACLSADFFDDITPVTKTELAEILVKSYGKPFTVVFDKADKTERKLRGRLLSSESILGRSTVEDLDEPDGKRVRLVDHRTLKSIIIDNVKFTLK